MVPARRVSEPAFKIALDTGFFFALFSPQMGNLSEHFSIEEFACPHCGQGLPSARLLEILEAARTATGIPFLITSGFRCAAHNAEVGGVEPSEHGNYLTGLSDAVDLYCVSSVVRFSLLKAFLALGVKRIGIGNAHLHIGVGVAFPQNVVFPDVEKFV